MMVEIKVRIDTATGSARIEKPPRMTEFEAALALSQIVSSLLVQDRNSRSLVINPFDVQRTEKGDSWSPSV